jgi:hypothetical protein
LGVPAGLALRSRRRRLEWLLVAAAAVAVAGVLTFSEPPRLRGDQEAYNLLVTKKLDPSLFPRDVLYRHDPDLLHVPWFLDLHAALARRLDGDVTAALQWLAWPIGAVYLAGHYVLFRVVSGPAPAALAAVSALTVRNSLGGEFWGFDGTRSAATRTIVAGLTPLLLALFLRWRTRRSFPIFFLVLGLLVNAHPVSAAHLAQATAAAHLWLARFGPRALGDIAAGVPLFAAGSLPFVAPFLEARDNVVEPAVLPVVRSALDYRFAYLLYPISPAALLSVSFHLALPGLAWLWWWRTSAPDDPARSAMRALQVVAGAAVGLGLLGTAVIQATGVWLDRPYIDIQQLRIVRLVYPVALAGLALAYARLLAAGAWRGYVVTAMLALATLLPPGELIHAFSAEERQRVKAWLAVEPMVRPPVEVAASRAALYEWVRRATPARALFLTDDPAFRRRTLRSVTGSFKDGAFLFVAGSRPFVEWYRLERDIRRCRARQGRDCWFGLARRLDVDYVVTDPALAEAGRPVDFQPIWAREGWSVWQRIR